MTIIEIKEDGWVIIRHSAGLGDTVNQGLGDIGIDVQIIDKRTFVHKIVNWIRNKVLYNIHGG